MRDHNLQQYRAAAERRDFAAQEQLISRHGKFFSAKDRLWLRHAKLADELRRARADGDRKRLEQVYDGLSKILRESEENSEIYNQAKRDRMAVLIALGRDQEALEDYRALARHQEQPDYVKEQYAQALAMNSRPVTASAQPPSVTNRPSTAKAAPAKGKVLLDALGNPIPPMDSAVEDIARGLNYPSNPGKARSLQFRVLPPIMH